MDRQEHDDVLVVTKLGSPGIELDRHPDNRRLAEMGMRVQCVALGGLDLTSPAGKMTMGVIAAVAQFERDLLIERTLSGQARARAEGKKFGRRPMLSNAPPRRCKLADDALVSRWRETKANRATIIPLGKQLAA